MGFRYEDVLEMCQKAVQMDKDKQGVSSDRGHIVNVDRKREDPGLDIRKVRRRIQRSFKKQLPEDKVLLGTTLPCSTSIIGGEVSLKKSQDRLFSS